MGTKTDTTRRQLILAAGLGVGVAGWNAFTRRARAPRFAVRDQPPRLNAGSIGRTWNTGQVLEPLEGRLSRMRWTVLAPPAGPTPWTRVRRGGPDGEVLAETPTTLKPALHGASWLDCTLPEPVAAGPEPLFVELTPEPSAAATPYAPVLRVRAMPAIPLGQATASSDASFQRRGLRTDFDYFTGLALGFKQLAPDSGVLRLRISRRVLPARLNPHPHQPDPSEYDWAPRVVERELAVDRLPALRRGHLFLPFEPIADSRGAAWEIEVASPPGAAIAGAPDDLWVLPYFGRLRQRAPWATAIVGGSPMAGVDLALALWLA
jgi:hypothetical protein